MWSFNNYIILKGLNCCSDTSISFHYQSPKDMRIIHYILENEPDKSLKFSSLINEFYKLSYIRTLGKKS